MKDDHACDDASNAQSLDDLRERAELWERASWHGLDAREAADCLEVDVDTGLGEGDVERRREVVGPNELPERERPGLWRIALRQFQDPLIYILLIAALVSLATGSFNNAIFITAVLVINAAVGTMQEYRAEHSAGELQQAVEIRARVRRDGEVAKVPAVDLVPGDVILVESGDAIPADARLLRSDGLRVDESLLTGESQAVSKEVEASLEDDAAIGDRVNLIHAGSLARSGRATAVVCRTGRRTEAGKIAASLAEGESQEPPLVVRLRRLTRVVGLFVLGAVALLAVVQRLRGAEWLDIFYLAVALSVSAIPAGLPVAITVALSIASRRMAKRNVIIRMLPAVEGLGACTLIASDKTGTLTENVLTAKRLALPDGGQLEVTGEGHALEGELRGEDGEVGEDQRESARAMAESGVACNWARLRRKGEEVEPEGDGVDVALLVLGEKLGLSSNGGDDDVVDAIPFESERRFAATFRRREELVVAHVKGAVEVILPMCRGAPDQAEAQETALAEEGFRVIAVAAGTVDEERLEDDPEGALEGLELLGLVGLIDPVRSEVGDALAACYEAGVDVRMITGDHPATGLAIARKVGIAEDDDRAVTGQELASGEAEATEAVVYARVEPTQKTDIVEALQSDAGHFVAVTGDGANDAPALRSAHIGVAMGESGTDVARSAADLILTDDNFASIVAGVEEGRVAYENVRKVVWLLLATGAGEVLLFFLALAWGMEIPLLPVQLLWLNLVTNGIQDVALAFEKGEPGILRRPPRRPDQPVVDAPMVEQILVSGLYIGSVAFGVYWYLIEQMGMPLASARNIVLLLVVLFENVHIFSCRSEHRSAFQVSLRDNPLLILAVAAAQGIHIATMYVPGLSDVLGMEPVTLKTWLTLFPVALSLLLVDELAKWLRRSLRREGGFQEARA